MHVYFYLLSFKTKSGHFLHSLQLSSQVHVFLYYTFVLLLPCQDLQNRAYIHTNTEQWTELKNKMAVIPHPQQCLDHRPYSPDLALLDYHLSPGPKKNWKVAIFQPTQRSFLQRRPGLDGQPSGVPPPCENYSNRLRSVLSFVGSVLNKSQVWLL